MLTKIRKGLGYLLYVSTSWLPHYQLGYSWPITKKIRQFAGKLLFDDCGKRVDIGRKIAFSSEISLGNRSGIGDEAYFIGKVKIGCDVMMGAKCAFIASNHGIADTRIPMNQQPSMDKEIVIEDDVWIGYGCTVLAGVHIGQGSVVGAGSVVTKDIPAYTVAGGVPAKKIRDRK